MKPTNTASPGRDYANIMMMMIMMKQTIYFPLSNIISSDYCYLLLSHLLSKGHSQYLHISYCPQCTKASLLSEAAYSFNT